MDEVIGAAKSERTSERIGYPGPFLNVTGPWLSKATIFHASRKFSTNNRVSACRLKMRNMSTP